MIFGVKGEGGALRPDICSPLGVGVCGQVASCLMFPVSGARFRFRGARFRFPVDAISTGCHFDGVPFPISWMGGGGLAILGECEKCYPVPQCCGCSSFYFAVGRRRVIMSGDLFQKDPPWAQA